MALPLGIRAVLRRNLRRSLVIAFVVGTGLVLINHGDHLMVWRACEHCLLKAGLSYLVPFLVSIVSVAMAARDQRRAPGGTLP